ncbi:hypothetical protein BDM02DRAFT_3191941 [Thelephora ganbajun]|uniref:Uncharacterized protein n=1 Tax=Thelephora ganbajun TaxID=370292 RepID=A0ACB6Z154_THEGA|nr:hypothetical protein BDM02DRAFT_3191941 [Thelephora ganbajun]
MASFHQHVYHCATEVPPYDWMLNQLLTLGLVDWEGVNINFTFPKDGLRFTAVVGEWLLKRQEVTKMQVQDQAQVIASSLDLTITVHHEKILHLESCVFELEHAMGEIKGEMLAVAVQLEHCRCGETSSSSPYASFPEDQGNEGPVTGELSHLPTTSKAKVLALMPSTACLPSWHM